MITGRAMCRHLVSLGIDVQKVVRKRETGDYVADFFVPQMQNPIAPAREWARQIRRVLPSASIIDTHDTVASWRAGEPVIYATVAFRYSSENLA